MYVEGLAGREREGEREKRERKREREEQMQMTIGGKRWGGQGRKGREAFPVLHPLLSLSLSLLERKGIKGVVVYAIHICCVGSTVELRKRVGASAPHELTITVFGFVAISMY